MSEELKNKIENLKIRYKSIFRDHLAKDFYVPCLLASYKLKRATSDFTSSVLYQYGEALPKLVDPEQEGCQIQILAEPKLQRKDNETLAGAIDKTEKDKIEDEIIEKIFEDAISIANGDLDKEKRLKVLAWLIKTKRMIIKFAIVEHVQDANIFHDKEGIFYLNWDDKKIGFNGSENETGSGLHFNGGSFSVFKSWVEGQKDYVEDLEKTFDLTWDNEAPGCKTKKMNKKILDLIAKYAPNDIKKFYFDNKKFFKNTKFEKIIEREKKSIDENKDIQSPKSIEDYLEVTEEKWRFQEEARLKFIEKKWGILEMATGTGKTRTALAIATQLINENKIDKIIIQMKGVDLIKQWVGNIDEWRNSKISREVNFLADERDDRDFFLGNFNNPDVDLLLIRQSGLPDLLDKIKDYDQKKTLIIHDEVHDLFAEQISEKILGKQKKFGYKLGLSATIREEFDKARERKLFEEIQGGGDKPAFEYSIEDAIADGVLVEMDLIPLEYELDEEEKSKIRDIFGIYKKNIDEGMSKWQAESIRNMSIADVKKNAKNKIVVFQNNLNKLLPKLKRSFIFADECDYGDKLLNILVPHLNVKTHYNDNETDKDNLKRFSNREIDCIINVLKLSQGIDIQSLDTAVLFATPKGRQLIQRLGRALRTDPNNINKKALVVDFFEKKEMKNKKGSDYNRYLQLKEYSMIKKGNL